MKIISAKELKNHTGKVLRYIKMNETAVVTSHGKKVAVIRSIKEEKGMFSNVRPFEEAWKDIEHAIMSKPSPYKTWQDAEDYSRARK